MCNGTFLGCMTPTALPSWSWRAIPISARASSLFHTTRWVRWVRGEGGGGGERGGNKKKREEERYREKVQKKIKKKAMVTCKCVWGVSLPLFLNGFRFLQLFLPRHVEFSHQPLRFLYPHTHTHTHTRNFAHDLSPC